MSEYSIHYFNGGFMADSMQEDALRRLNQMYSKAPSGSVASQRREAEPPQQTQEQTKELKTPGSPKNQSNLLEIFMKDKEKSLILLLIVILISEKADSSLLLALMYLVI